MCVAAMREVSALRMLQNVCGNSCSTESCTTSTGSVKKPEIFMKRRDREILKGIRKNQPEVLTSYDQRDSLMEDSDASMPLFSEELFSPTPTTASLGPLSESMFGSTPNFSSLTSPTSSFASSRQSRPVTNPVAIFKYVIVGDANVGKSSIMDSYVHQEFHEQKYQTVPGVPDVGAKTIALGDEYVQMQLWDVDGKDPGLHAHETYRGAAAVFLVYDVTNRASLTKLETLYEQAKKLCNARTTFVLIGTQSDRKGREVSCADARSFAVERDIMTTMDVSAKTGDNIADVFEMTARTIFENFNDGVYDGEKEILGLMDHKKTRPFISEEYPPSEPPLSQPQTTTIRRRSSIFSNIFGGACSR